MAEENKKFITPAEPMMEIASQVEHLDWQS
jgi:hypothetical protein